MNKISTHLQHTNSTWKILCWSVLLAILFQSIFIANANAFSLQTASIYTVCNHLNDQSNHNDTNCKQHCASSIEHYTQNFLVDSFSPLQVEHNAAVLAYFNPKPEALIQQSNNKIQPLKRLILAPTHYPPAIYLSTSRLRI